MIRIGLWTSFADYQQKETHPPTTEKTEENPITGKANKILP